MNPRIPKRSVNELNSEHLTHLQVAARDGISTTLKQLIDSNADIDATNVKKWRHNNAWTESQSYNTALFHAVDRGNLYEAQILLACGAKKELAIARADELKQPELSKKLAKLELNPHVLTGLLVWIIRTHTDERESDNNYHSLFIKVLNAFATNFQNSQVILSGLLQLSIEYSQYIFADHLNKKVRTTKKAPHPKKTKLTAAQQELYNAAIQGNLPDITKFTRFDLRITANALYQQQQILALDALHKKVAPDNIKHLLKNSLANNDTDFVQFWMQASGITPYEFALICVQDEVPKKTALLAPIQTSLPESESKSLPVPNVEDIDAQKKELLAQLIANIWSVEGALQAIFSRGVLTDKLLSAQNKNLFKQINAEPQTIITSLMNCIYDRYHFPCIYEITPAQGKLMINTLNTLTPENSARLAALFSRFDMGVTSSINKLPEHPLRDILDDVHIPSQPQNIIFSYFDGIDLRRLWRDQISRDMALSLNPSEEWVRNVETDMKAEEDLDKVIRYTAALDEFTQQVEQDIAAAPCWKGCYNKWTCCQKAIIPLMVVGAAGITVGAYFVNLLIPEKLVAYDSLDHTYISADSSISCASYYSVSFGAVQCMPDVLHPAVAACDDACSVFADKASRIAGAGAGIAVSGVVSLVSWFAASCLPNRQERIDSLTSVELSLEADAAAKKMVAECKDATFAGIDINTAPLGNVRKKVSEAKSSTTKTIEALNESLAITSLMPAIVAAKEVTAEKKQDHVIDIPDDSIAANRSPKSSPSSSPRSSPRFLNDPNHSTRQPLLAHDHDPSLNLDPDARAERKYR